MIDDKIVQSTRIKIEAVAGDCLIMKMDYVDVKLAIEDLIESKIGHPLGYVSMLRGSTDCLQASILCSQPKPYRKMLKSVAEIFRLELNVQYTIKGEKVAETPF